MSEITVNYEIFGALKTKFKNNRGSEKIEESTTVREFLKDIAGIPEKYFKYMDVAVNDRACSMNRKLKNNNNLKVLMPLGGG